MSLGSRILRRGRRVLSASAVPCSTPRDPLLFLYPPTWTSTIATAQVQPAINTGSEQDAHNSRYPLRPSINTLHSVGSQNCLPEPSLGEKDIPDDSNPTSANIEIETDGGAIVAKGHSSVLWRSMTSTSTEKGGDLLVHQVATDTSHTRKADDSLLPIPRESKRTIAPGKSRQTTAGVKHNGFVRRVLSSMDKRRAQQAYHKSVKQAFQDMIRKEQDLPLGDWRKILQSLKYHTSRQLKDGYNDVVRILVPNHFVKKLFFDSKGAIWNIQTHHACHITLTKEPAEDPGCTVILLSGPTTGIAGAAAELVDLAPGSISDENPLSRLPQEVIKRSSDSETHHPSKSSQLSSIRYVLYAQYRRSAPPIRGDMVHRPLRWTIPSFARYIEHLTCISMPSHAHHLLYSPGETHQDIVMGTLRSLFLDPECESAISVSAFNDAITYLVRHSFYPAVHMLYLHMDKIGLKFNSETYNIMLRHAAKQSNLYKFASVLRMMTRSGCSPNANTWVAFLMALESAQFKLHVIADMKEKHLLHDLYVRKAVCEQLVSYEIQVALEKEVSQDEFLEHMASSYGQGWLTVASANRILDSLGSRGLVSRCWDFTHFIRAEGIRMDAISIATILHHCEKHANYDGALEIIRRMHSIDAFVASEAIYHCLFKMAWKGHMYATARVIWAYACSDVATSFRMRRKVRRSASTAFAYPNVISSPAGTMTVNTFWRSTVGPFILGHPFLSSLRLSSLLEVRRGLVESREKLGQGGYLFVCTYDSLISGHELLIEGHHLLFERKDLTKAGQSRLTDPGNHTFDNKLQCPLPPLSSQPISFYHAASEAPSTPSSRAPGTKSTNEFIKQAIEKHIEISREWIPINPFPKLLLEAWEMDKEWRSNGGIKAKNLDVRLQKLSATAPRILLRRRTTKDPKEIQDSGLTKRGC